MLGASDSSKVGETLVCKEGISLGVSEWKFEGITKGTMLGPIRVIIQFSSLGIFDWNY